ncbi:hypothetical protein [Natronosalvus caseinilyticus]|uniref:hypothetical protein n=1 Tax=Natronosalvus caseinilyticus TaxID=2953747 RepID=UPI0028B0D0C8|nr:hypothetical protein [Natronosalvus caseinilyticus]
MQHTSLIPSKTALYHAAGLFLRVYITIVIVTTVYSLLWLLEIAGYLDEQIIGVIWISIAAMGSVFLVLLIPLYWSSRSKSR